LRRLTTASAQVLRLSERFLIFFVALDFNAFAVVTVNQDCASFNVAESLVNLDILTIAVIFFCALK